MRPAFVALAFWAAAAPGGPIAAYAASPGTAGRGNEPADVLVKVNGVSITRSDVAERAYRRHGTAILNELADDILVRQAAQAAKVRTDAKEVQRRFQEVRSRFPDQAAFERSLAANGTSPDELRGRLEQQVLREALVTKEKGLKVTSEEIEKFFEGNKERLGTPEAVRLRILLAATQREADGFLTALRSGADFGALASQVSLDEATKTRGGDMGFVVRGVLQPEIEKRAFEGKPGEILSIPMAAGYALIKVEERREAKPPKPKDVRDDIRRALMAEKITAAWQGYLKELREKAKYETP